MKTLIDAGMREAQILGEVIEIWPLHCHNFSLRCLDCLLIGKIRCHPRFWLDPEKDSVEKICPVCGTVFTAQIWELRRGRGIFCSKPCVTIAKFKVGMLSGRPRTGEMVPCAICGTPIYRPKGKLEKCERFFCNRSCKSKDSGGRFGIGSPDHPITKDRAVAAHR